MMREILLFFCMAPASRERNKFVWLRNADVAIGRFRVNLCLCVKTSPRAKPFL